MSFFLKVYVLCFTPCQLLTNYFSLQLPPYPYTPSSSDGSQQVSINKIKPFSNYLNCLSQFLIPYTCNAFSQKKYTYFKFSSIKCTYRNLVRRMPHVYENYISWFLFKGRKVLLIDSICKSNYIRKNLNSTYYHLSSELKIYLSRTNQILYIVNEAV